jgi:hypothetical protein
MGGKSRRFGKVGVEGGREGVRICADDHEGGREGYPRPHFRLRRALVAERENAATA